MRQEFSVILWFAGQMDDLNLEPERNRVCRTETLFPLVLD